MRKGLGVASLAILLTAVAQPAAAGAITFTGTSGSHSAKATFENLANGNLVVTLENVGGDALAPADILTAVFFSTSNANALTPASAVLFNSVAVFDPDGQPAGGVVGGEWAYGA